MVVWLFAAIALLADPPSAAAPDPAPTYGPALPKPPKPAPPVKPANDACAANRASAAPGEIIVCAQRQEGYRIDPDVLTASRQKRRGGRPKPRDTMKDNSCATIGPMGCRGGGINLIAAAMTAAEMAGRLAKGEEIGSMFITDPQPTEYQLYVEAKRRREAKEAQAAAKVKAKAAVAAGQAETVKADPANVPAAPSPEVKVEPGSSPQ
jgi:hypothetical protein